MMGLLEKVWNAAYRRLKGAPFRLGLQMLYPGTYLSYVPDRFSGQRAKYLATDNVIGSSYINKFLEGNKTNNAGDIARYYFLILTVDQILKEKLDGDIVELGVYKGNTASILAALAQKAGKTAFFFDTFEGFSKSDLVGIDGAQPKNFHSTSLNIVKKLVGKDHVSYIKGWFPESLNQINKENSYCLVHLDCDLYAPFKSALEFFYSRLVPGGFLIMHDYSSFAWAGAEQAIDEFFSGKPEKVVLIPDKSGTAVVRKVKLS